MHHGQHYFFVVRKGCDRVRELVHAEPEHSGARFIAGRVWRMRTLEPFMWDRRPTDTRGAPNRVCWIRVLRQAKVQDPTRSQGDNEDRDGS